MNFLVSKWVWIERGMVFVATLASGIGWATGTESDTVAAGGTAGAVAFMQVLGAILTHVKTLEHKVEPLVVSAAAAAEAGKAPVQ